MFSLFLFTLKQRGREKEKGHTILVHFVIYLYLSVCREVLNKDILKKLLRLDNID